MFWRKKKKQKFFFKANDDVLSFCQCENAPAMSEAQLDCPWCGCGWMIACSKCTKSFVFAEVRETDIPLIELGRREAAARGLKTVTERDIAEWAEGMAETLDKFEVGDIVVYLDGAYWTVDSTDVQFDGYYASHKFDRLPHAEALDDQPRLRQILGEKQYWFDRKRPDRE
ncbi:hypothetical protein [Sphingopyxis sp. L1A2A]|uniref:hypothetical protein n=1 Tax=Sphingopyxis sp. L1A2A TaxID=2502247 RepID=UPI0010F99CB5|nr:hypothetical protein [Sphingopyxis sp. L1A2A]